MSQDTAEPMESNSLKNYSEERSNAQGELLLATRDTTHTAYFKNPGYSSEESPLNKLARQAPTKPEDVRTYGNKS